jgi:hypothetical protein
LVLRRILRRPLHGQNGNLWTYGLSTGYGKLNGDTTHPMRDHTSPSIAGTADILAAPLGGFINVPDYQIAYTSNTAALTSIQYRFPTPVSLNGVTLADGASPGNAPLTPAP